MVLLKTDVTPWRFVNDHRRVGGM